MKNYDYFKLSYGNSQVTGLSLKLTNPFSLLQQLYNNAASKARTVARAKNRDKRNASIMF